MEAKTLAELETKYFGKPGTPTREQYEFELNMELVGAKTWKEIEIEHTPETIKAIKEPAPKKDKLIQTFGRL